MNISGIQAIYNMKSPNNVKFNVSQLVYFLKKKQETLRLLNSICLLTYSIKLVVIYNFHSTFLSDNM